MGSSGRIGSIVRLSTDPEQLLLAAAAVEALPLTSSRRAEQLIELASGLPAPDGGTSGFVDAFGQPLDLDLATRAAVAKMRIFENEERRRAELSFDALEAFCDALWAVEGRTSLVWVSSGVRLMRAGPSVALMAAFEDAGQAALKAPVAAVVPGIRSMRAGLTDPDARLVRRQERLFEAALREVDADASRYYLITYAPPRAQPDGAAHQIRVEVERAGVSARWRRGYVHLTEAERRQRTAQAARLVPGLVEGASKMARARRADEEAARVAATTAEAIEAGEVAGNSERARAAEGVPPLRPTEATPPAAQPRAVGEAADARPPADPRVLSRTLDRLAQTALFYRASALSFSCDETITASTFNSGGGFRRRSAYDLRYIYTFEDPPTGSSPGTFRRLRDYRTRRDEEVAPGQEPGEVKLESLGLPVAVTRAYSWAFMFQEALQPHYRFELVEEESYLDREVLVISFEPVPPVVAGFNDWFGRAWIDAETYQVLRVEALQAGDYAQLDAIDKDRVTLQVPRDGRLVVRMEAEFGVEERGVRLPSRVVLTGEDFSMRALAFGLPGDISSALPEWRLKGRAAFRVEQRYENYRFFDVEVR